MKTKPSLTINGKLNCPVCDTKIIKVTYIKEPIVVGDPPVDLGVTLCNNCGFISKFVMKVLSDLIKR